MKVKKLYSIEKFPFLTWDSSKEPFFLLKAPYALAIQRAILIKEKQSNYLESFYLLPGFWQQNNLCEFLNKEKQFQEVVFVERPVWKMFEIQIWIWLRLSMVNSIYTHFRLL